MSVAELLKKKREQLEQFNKEEGAKYLANFAARENAIVLPSGIVYEIIALGNGKKATLDDIFECNYSGTNCKGEVFDATKGKTAIFSLKKLIKAYQEVVPLLPMGTIFKMVTPPEFAYRDEHISKEIGPYSTLIFEVELINIK